MLRTYSTTEIYFDRDVDNSLHYGGLNQPKDQNDIFFFTTQTIFIPIECC